MAEAGEGSEVQLKKLHPFFSAPVAASKTDDAVTPPTPDPSCSPASDESRDDPIEKGSYQCEPSERKRKRRKTEPPPGGSEATPTASRTKRRTRVSAGPSIVKHFGQGHVEGKQPEAGQTGEGELLSEPLSCSVNPNPAPPSGAAGIECSTLGDQENRVPESTCAQKSQKLLKLNPATGTIGPPPRPKPSVPPKRRGRKPKAFVVAASYGTDPTTREQIGQRINGVLSGTTRIFTTMLTNPTPSTPPSYQGNTNVTASGTAAPREGATVLPKKSAHPFFQAKAKGASSIQADGHKASKTGKAPSKRQVIFTSTPCSPGQARPAPSNLSLSNPGSKKSNMKIPGAQHAAWPWRGMVHVRDDLSPQSMNSVGHEPNMTNFRRRKAKGQAIHISQHESILYGSASKIGIRQIADDLKLINNNEFHPIAHAVRVPIKHFESGRKLQTRIVKELRTVYNNGSSLKTHPAIGYAYSSIPTTLSAFDKSTCESVSWAQKYAPTSAQCVLQSGREAELLRDWLQSLKVQAVDTGASDNTPKLKNSSAPTKKRRKNKLEGFVVSSDEESNEMGEISDNEPQWLVHGAKKTVMRPGDGVDRGGKPSNRLANAVLLSGPHGCGKTATVYAIAKELDFEVFEINAGARRSGKDILEKVGDMTRNHLVQHHQKEEQPTDIATDDEVAKDLKSGKQGMMTTFFKPKPSQHKQSQSTKEADKAGQTHEAPVAVPQEKKPIRDQKQSLILLEEVDLLYEEDKQFWTTVISMIAQSKRPFVMTCNDESLIPLQNLKLHGIFRLSSPPVDLAVDMLLLIAANEGHLLKRHAIETLYESRGHDLRAAITELNYWCQIGVGDLRGGFDWFYPRWPPGSDIDEEGQTIRVVSQNAYHIGMGWLSRDLATVESSLSSIVPDVHREAWEHWGLDISDHHEIEDPSRWVKKSTEQASSRVDRLALLQSVEAFADVVSESDLYGPFLPPLSNRIALDATIPNLHTKTLDDFTIGHKILEVAPLSYYASVSQDLSTSLRILAQSELLGEPSSHYEGRFGEMRITDDIERHLKMAPRSEHPITRKDYSMAFDPIAASDKILANNYLDPSVFDREMTLLCLDVAPYVRSIMSYDQRLHNERRMRSNLLSEGGRPEKKRIRTTRAALSALEGGSRATTRRERYFAADVNTYLVMRTGGKGWEELVHQMDESRDKDLVASQENSDMEVEATSEDQFQVCNATI